MQMQGRKQGRLSPHGFTLIEPFDPDEIGTPIGSEPQGRRQDKLPAARKRGFTSVGATCQRTGEASAKVDPSGYLIVSLPLGIPRVSPPHADNGRSQG